MSSQIIKIANDGTITAIYSDELAELIAQGEAMIFRASHVEPVGAAWIADLAPMGGPILGPFLLRQTALEAEVKWLESHLF